MNFDFVKKNRSKTIMVRVSLEDYNKICQIMKEYNISRSKVISEIVRVSLKEKIR